MILMAILSYIKEQNNVIITTISRNSNLSYDVAIRYMKILEENNLVLKKDGKFNSHTYRISEKGRFVLDKFLEFADFWNKNVKDCNI